MTQYAEITRDKAHFVEKNRSPKVKRHGFSLQKNGIGILEKPRKTAVQKQDYWGSAIPPLNFAVKPKKVPSWYDISMAIQSVSFENIVQFVLAVYPEFEVSRVNPFIEVYQAYHTMKDSEIDLKVYQGEYEIELQMSPMSYYWDYDIGFFEFGLAKLFDEMTLFLVMDVLSLIAEPLRDFEYFDYHIDAIDQDPLSYYDTKKEARQRVKKLNKEKSKIEKLREEYLHKFRSEQYPCIRENANWIAEYYFWKGYVNTAKVIWKNTELLELMFDMAKSFKGEIRFHTPIGILLTKDEEILDFINECTYSMEEEPKYSVVFFVDDENPVEFSLLPLYVNYFMNQFHEAIIKDYNHANPRKPDSNLQVIQ